MKKIIFLSAMMCLLAISAFSQKTATTDFSGKWELDTAKSKLDERMRIESMTMNVSQTEKDIKIEISTKRSVAPEGQNAPPPPPAGNRGGGMRGGMGGGFGGGDMTATYNLDGKESVVQQETPRGAMAVTQKGKIEDKKLKLSSSRTFNGPMGEITMTTKETWELTDGGKGLKVTRESESPRGTQTTEMYFTKK